MKTKSDRSKKSFIILLILIVGLTIISNLRINAQEFSTGPIPNLMKDRIHTQYIISENSALADIAYAHNSQGGATLSMPIPAGTPFTTLSTWTAPNFASSMTKGGDGIYYLTDNGPPGTLYSFDPGTGSVTLLTALSGNAEGPNGIAYNPTDNMYYMIGNNEFYTVDVGSGVVTLIGNTGVAGSAFIDLCFDTAGVCFAYDLALDAAYTINPGTGVATMLGPLGYDASFGQGMSYDMETSTIYLSAFNNGTFTGQLRTMDPTTGATTLITDWGVNQLAPFAINNQYGQHKDIWVDWECNMEIEILSGRFNPGTDIVSVRGDFNGWSTFDLIVDPIDSNFYVSPYSTLFPQHQVGDTIIAGYKFFYTPSTWETGSDRLYVLTQDDYDNSATTISRSFNDITCPILTPSNPIPTDYAVNISLTGNTLNWVNGAGATQIEIWFGKLDSLTQVYDGELINSYPLSPFEPLQYGTSYGWQVIGKDSTCSNSGPLWTFTTEQDPSLIIDTIKIYPQNDNYWTGTCNSTTKTEVSIVRGIDTEDGWFVFDLSSLPGGSAVSSIKFYGYVNATYYPFWSLTPMGTIDPRTASASEIKTYVEANSAQGVAYVYSNESSSFTTGWHNWTLEPQANIDLQNAISQGWFACGMDSRNNSASYGIVFDGWAQTNKPYLEIIYGYTIPTAQLTVNIENGWNLVSIPGLHPVNQDVITWWPGQDPVGRVYKYSSGYQPVTVATPTEGYWMKHLGAQTYDTGDEWPAGGIGIVPHDSINGFTGWNLIGGYELSVSAANLTTNPPGLLTGPVYWYSGGYQVATTLDPGYGYWVKLTDTAQVIIPETLAKETEVVDYFPADWGKIMLTDAEGISYTLYAIKGEIDLTQYELPPPPPEGMFDIRYGSGRVAEDLSKGVQSIKMSGIKYPIRVKVENMKITLKDETGKVINIELESDEEISIDNVSNNKLLVISGELATPIEYALEQNYPNPFNPVTTIKFSIPKATDVTLTIYNVLGEKVTQIVNAKLEAGRYSYQWNASNVATGMYLYELRTDKFVSVKKLILLR